MVHIRRVSNSPISRPIQTIRVKVPRQPAEDTAGTVVIIERGVKEALREFFFGGNPLYITPVNRNAPTIEFIDIGSTLGRYDCTVHVVGIVFLG